MTRLVFVTLAIVVMLARPSQAQGPVAKGPPEKRAGAIDPIVAERVRDIQQSKGPEIYAALRALWRAWELADPDQVEAAIAVAAEDASLPAAARAYAGMIGAYARRRRGDLIGAERRIAALGFVRDWLVVGPFQNENKTGLGIAQQPELELDAPVLFDRSYQGKERPVGWRRAPSIHRFGWLDLGAMMRPTRDVCVYASTFVKSERAMTATLWVGAAGAFKLYFDDAAVLADGDYRELDSDRHAVAVDLAAGEVHRITAKVCGADSSAAVTLRIADKHGAPMPGMHVEASEQASTAAAKRMREKRDARPAVPAKRTNAKEAPAARGPIQELDRLLAASPNDPSLLESYARYLMITGGDAEDTHHARDYAARAVEAEPTVTRLLLAAELAEDRNGRRGFIERAEGLAKKPHDRIAVLLAKAQLVRGGPNWRDAVPIYRELLELDPQNTLARLGMVDLYIEAGLPRTAMSELERALEHKPSSVALLRAAVAQLRALGRDTEAAEMEARYAALRFDDAGFLQEQLALAVARRDLAGATRWASRLTGSEPASVWAHDQVAKAMRSLGRTDEALKSYQRALDAAPEDTAVLRALADIHGEQGDRQRQRDLLKSVVRLAPQDTAARDYLEQIDPSKARDDEKYAWAIDRFREPSRAPRPPGVSLRNLRKLTVTTVFDSGLASRFHQLVFQPLTQEAAQRARRYSFSYHADRQIVELRAARVHKQDGRVEETVTTGEGPLNDPSINMYTLQRLVHVQLPEIEPGDVVELRYRIDDTVMQNDMADYFGEIEYLQDVEPSASAEYVLIAPTKKKLYVQISGLGTVNETTTQEGERTVRRFEAKDVPAVAIEPGMPPLSEVLGRVHTSSISSWSDVGRWYWGLAKDKLDPDDDVRRLARQLTRGMTDPRQQVAAVYRYAAGELRYVALELGIEGIRPRRATLTLARGWGDCKDKATLIVSMLRELGIDANLVLVRTGLRGRFDEGIASLAPFDHAIAYVPKLDLYLDGTAEATGSGELPSMDRGAMALRIEGGEGKLVSLPESGALASREEHDVELELDQNGALQVRAKLSGQGPDASSWRRRYHAEATRRERVAADLSALVGAVELEPDGLEASNLDDLEIPVTVGAKGKGNAARDGVAWSIPMGTRMAMVAAHAQLQTRTHPLVIGSPRIMRDSWTVTLPQNARILSQPKAVKYDTPLARYELTVETQGSKITVRTTLEIKRSRVQPDEYSAWRELCRNIDAAGSPRLLVAR